LYEFGDALVSIKGGDQILVTTDLSTKYIKSKRNYFEKNLHKFKIDPSINSYRKFKREKELRGIVKVFNWTKDTLVFRD